MTQIPTVSLLSPLPRVSPASPEALHVSWSGDALTLRLQVDSCILVLQCTSFPDGYAQRPPACSWRLAVLCVLAAHVPGLALCPLDGAHVYKQPASLEFLREPLCPHKPLLVSAIRRSHLPCVFSYLLKLVALEPANPFRTNTNLYRLECHLFATLRFLANASKKEKKPILLKRSVDLISQQVTPRALDGRADLRLRAAFLHKNLVFKA